MTGLAALLLVLAGSAAAQQPPAAGTAAPAPAAAVPRAPLPRGIAAALHRRGLAQLEVALTTWHEPAAGAEIASDAVSFSPRADFRVPLFGRLALDAIVSVPWASVSAEGMGSAGAVRLGNPYLGGSFQWDWVATRFRIGLGVVAEIGSGVSSDDDPATIGSEDARVAARNGPVKARAGFDSWLWGADANGLVMPARFDTLLAEQLLLEVDGSMALLTGRDGTFDPFLLVGAAGSWIVEEVLALGGRLVICSGVPRDDDAAQVSFEPFVRWAEGMAEARLGVPLRFDGSLGGGWGIRVSGALTW